MAERTTSCTCRPTFPSRTSGRSLCTTTRLAPCCRPISRPQRQQSRQGNKGECGRVGGCVLRSESSRGRREQLGTDHPQKGLVYDPTTLRPARTVVRQDVAAWGDRTSAVTHRGSSSRAALSLCNLPILR